MNEAISKGHVQKAAKLAKRLEEIQVTMQASPTGAHSKRKFDEFCTRLPRQRQQTEFPAETTYNDGSRRQPTPRFKFNSNTTNIGKVVGVRGGGESHPFRE